MSSASGSQEPPREGRRASSARGNADLDPVLRNTLRYTALRRAAPTPANVDKALQPRKGNDDYNARAVRHALRVFAVSWLGMKGWDAVARKVKDKEWLFRFLTRLRTHLLQPEVEPFRLRNPRTAATLTSPYAPALGASFAGLALGIYPRRQLRVTIAIYSLFRALEFGWNACEAEGLIWGVKNGRRRRDLGGLEAGCCSQWPSASFPRLRFDRDCLPEYDKLLDSEF
ncbi:unnamed protein product, partial [Clonostachys rosea f. rosea IK726]